MLKPTEYDLKQLLHATTSNGVKVDEHPTVTTKLKQRLDLQQNIQNLEVRLKKLEALIKRREIAEASENRKGKAKKERSAKETDKPDSTVEKTANGNSSGKKSESKPKSASELKSLATKVRGQIAVAKQKLAAL